MIGFMIKTQIVPKLIHTYSTRDMNIIFDLQQRVVANMILNKDCDIDTFIRTIEDHGGHHHHDDEGPGRQAIESIEY
jgi:hypothetical protein